MSGKPTCDPKVLAEFNAYGSDYRIIESSFMNGEVERFGDRGWEFRRAATEGEARLCEQLNIALAEVEKLHVAFHSTDFSCPACGRTLRIPSGFCGDPMFDCPCQD